MRTLLLILTFLLLMFLGGAVWYLAGYTLLNVPLFIGIIGFISLVTGVVMANRWEKITRIRHYILNFGIHVVVFGLILSFMVLLINYTTAGLSKVPPTEVTVEKKMTKTRYRSKRVGRRSYTRGEPYNVYFLELDIPERGEHSFQVSKSVYSSVKKGESATIKISRGALGMSVIDPNSIMSSGHDKWNHGHRNHTGRQVNHYGIE